MRQWNVAGGLLADERGLLLVANQRRGGLIDWSTPGGVVDDGETPLQALSREVHEETGIAVDAWVRRCWTVHVHFVDMAMKLDVEVHQARSFSGALVIEDPDEIVTAAEWCSPAVVAQRLEVSPRWVRDPLAAWVESAWVGERHFSYEARGQRIDNLEVEQLRGDES